MCLKLSICCPEIAKLQNFPGIRPGLGPEVKPNCTLPRNPPQLTDPGSVAATNLFVITKFLVSTQNQNTEDTRTVLRTFICSSIL